MSATAETERRDRAERLRSATELGRDVMEPVLQMAGRRLALAIEEIQISTVRPLKDEIERLKAELTRVKDALRMYARHDHWMALSEEVNSPQTVWIARTHFDDAAHGYSTAEQVLARLSADRADLARDERGGE